MDAIEMLERAESQTAIKIGVIGIGNGGSQAATVASKHMHNVLVLNTSVKDMSDVVLAKEIHAIQIGDGRGSGKDRDNAMTLLKNRGAAGLREILENPYFKGTVEPADVVFVIFSTGGGTGSGIGPYVASLVDRAYPGKLVIPYGILPKESESVLAQANTIACVDDMAKLGTPYMLADLEHYSDVPMEQAYKSIGDYIAKTIDVIRGDYLKISTAGMADERDIMTVISQPGYMAVHFVNGILEKHLATKTIQGHLIDAIKSSPACRIQKDGVVVYNCIVTNTNSSIDDAVKAGNHAELNAYIGEPKATFSNYSVDDTTNVTEVISIMSGLSLPMDRFIPMRAKIKENKDKYNQASTLSLASDREAAAFTVDSGRKSIILNSQKSGEQVDLSFLDGEV